MSTVDHLYAEPIDITDSPNYRITLKLREPLSAQNTLNLNLDNVRIRGFNKKILRTYKISICFADKHYQQLKI